MADRIAFNEVVEIKKQRPFDNDCQSEWCPKKVKENRARDH